MATLRATYRLQLRPGFDFDDAAALAPYLSALGVSHVYASPYLQAAPGSTHGYDVVDPGSVNRELGGDAGRARLVSALEREGLGQVLDIVPNHMAISGPENRWWWDVLRNGPASRFAPYFDVDWDPPEAKLRDQVLLPILGDHYGRELEAGRIQLHRDGGAFTIRYQDHVFPVAPRSLGGVLLRAADGVDDAGAARELAFLGRSLERLPEPALRDDEARATRRADLEALDERVEALLTGEGTGGAVDAAVDAAVAVLNADVDALDALLDAQSYRLAFWRTGGQELDYRRFFDIDTLAALRTEDPEVFQAVHARVLEWLADGELDGVRVDHPDGLRRPGHYFQRLRSAAPEAWIVAEKILMPDEPPPPWPVDGTTGYDFLNDLGGVFLDPAGEEPFTDLWTTVSGDDRPYEEVAYEARRDILRDVLAADVNRLANIFVDLCESRRRYRDYTRSELHAALTEVAAGFPVYRTYVGEDGTPSDRDRAVVETAVSRAGDRRPELDGALLEFLADVLLGRVDEPEARGLRMRFQQLTGPVAAKGEEDTAFYRYARFVALNEVGGDPGRWGLSVDAFHGRMAERAERAPRSMNALSTHDTKRAEDVRARLYPLSEVPDRWNAAVDRWTARNAGLWPGGVDRDRVMEYLLYQTAVGAWPLSEDRLAAYMEKASREAKLRTSWTVPNEEYDAALRAFVAGIYREGRDAGIAELVEPLIAPGRVVALGQKLVQLTAPGIPDVYQGTELWDLSLVDPDNRRPVDFHLRREILDFPHDDPLEGLGEGRPKMRLVRAALAVRAERPDAFGSKGGYEPLRAEGSAGDHVLAFLRGDELAVVVPRLLIRLGREGGWGDTVVRLPPGRWRDALTGVERRGGPVRVADLLERFPAALLTRASAR